MPKVGTEPPYLVVEVNPEGISVLRQVPNIRSNRAPAYTGPEFLNRVSTPTELPCPARLS
jgi:hypothetical protein